ncbi:MAG TPA: ABC transporter ATP-binding protein [Acidimicrobiales bacterium]|nr:ABC transporter ATP-binding protein [Acidimicrobiales bacterium]
MTRRERRRAGYRLLARSLRGRRRQLAGLAGWSLVEALPAFLSGRLLARALDHGFLAHRSATGFAWLGVLALAVVAGAWGARQTYLRLAALVEPFRDELVELVVTGALRDATSPGRIGANGGGVARVTHHVEILREAYAGVLMTAQGFVVTAISALVGLVGLLPAASVLVVPPLVVGLLVFAAALGPLAARQRASILAEEALSDASSVMAEGLRDIVACGGEQTVFGGVDTHIEAHASATRALARLTAVRTCAVAIGGWLPVVLLLVGGRWLVRNGASTGELLGALTYVVYGVHPALQTLVRELGGSGLWLFVTLDRVVEATGGCAAEGPSPTHAARELQPAGYEIRLDDVTFRYGTSPEPVITHLDLVVPEGDHLAIVGPSGVGKSTLAGLIAGLLAPDGGDVLIGGVDASRVAAAGLPPLRVLIPQEAYVFAGTVLENLTYLRDDVPMAEVDEVVDLLGARPLVERLGGHRAALSPQSLSSGERQLLTLVRSYLSPAPVVVLDEATSHLDPAAEALVERAFASRPGTLIVIAHRISSALRAGRVLVLDGAVPAVGAHDELLSDSVVYRNLVGHWS